ncbi:MAG: CHASE2 domain-containing protein [Candidatus Riflebacteria bacterium]|nr:CHASE2 domain-containing protein [Candidatus Riflebacteria bacterium]
MISASYRPPPPEIVEPLGESVFNYKVDNVSSDTRLVFFTATGETREISLARTAQDSHIPGVIGGNHASISLPNGECEVLAFDGARRGRIDRVASTVRGRVAFVGTSLAEDQDFVRTPVNFLRGEYRQMPGVNLHAHLVWTLDEGSFLRPLFFHPDAAPDTWPLRILLLLLPLLLISDWLFTRIGALRAVAVVAVFGTSWIGCSLALFKAGLLLPFALPVISLGTFASARGYSAYAESREREKVARFTFGRFVSAAMVDQMLQNPDSVKPGGEKRTLSVIFTDLAGFTSISEAMTPEGLVMLMNEYLGEMTSILFEYNGTLDKYIGDALMGFWNFPAERPDHAIAACRCAIAMQQRLVELRKRWKERGLPDVSMRAGINTADCVVGFIGSEIHQMNFTCMGDGVNLASRLEGANKAYGTLMMIAESTRDAIAGTDIRTRFLDFLAVKGKEKPIRVFELIGLLGIDDKIWRVILPAYEKGIEQYLARSWEDAIASFTQVLALRPDDGPAKTYIDRCRAFSLEPPGEKWDGSFHLKSK